MYPLIPVKRIPAAYSVERMTGFRARYCACRVYMHGNQTCTFMLALADLIVSLYRKDRLCKLRTDHRTPRQVESEMIMAHVNGAEVPIFVNKKIHDIDCLEDEADYDGFGDVTMKLMLVRNERSVACIY
jgi:hypothetical protein